MSYQNARNVRREPRTIVGRTRGGKLAPVYALHVGQNEGGMVSQDVVVELDPIAGRLKTPITAELTAVFVPVQAMDALKDPESDYAGLTEVIREKLLSGNPLFGLENPNEISRRCRIIPRKVGGIDRVSEKIRLGHNAAVNYLRQRKYNKAALLTSTNKVPTPALISQTVLDRMNAVLDPDDRINGAVDLELGEVLIPVRGIGNVGGAVAVPDPSAVKWSGLGTETASEKLVGANYRSAGDNTIAWTNAYGAPIVFADLAGITAGNVSLVDFYNAEKMDEIVRKLRQVVTDNPEYGEEMVLRMVHGLSVDTGKTPFVIAHREAIFGRDVVGAIDATGVENDVMRSDMVTRLQFTVPIPRTELGGIIFTFLSVKPDETLDGQPHPFLSDNHGLDNYAADELALDPVPVTMRELDTNVPQANENTVAFYTGLNQLKALYMDYGLSLEVDPQTVENKSALWQHKIPVSVTPDNILYPEDLPHYPFADQLAEVVNYTITNMATFQTPMIIGPTPVEQLDVIDAEDIFEQGEE